MANIVNPDEGMSLQDLYELYQHNARLAFEGIGQEEAVADPKGVQGVWAPILIKKSHENKIILFI